MTVTTFLLLWCEDCGRAEQPEPGRHVEAIAAPQKDPMRCAECGRPLALLEALIAPESSTYRDPDRGFGPWQHVAFADRIPARTSRQREWETGRRG